MSKEEIKKILENIKDPELGIDIVSLGLIRDISIDEVKENSISGVEVLMTLTTPFCPFADDLISEVESELEKAGFSDVRVELTFDPPWQASEELRAQFGI